MRRKILLAAVFAIAFGLLAAGPSPAANVLHLKLDKSMPEAEQILTAAPEKVVLEFSQKPELAVSRIELKKADAAVKVSKVASSEEDETVLWVAVEELLADGAYTVNWTTASSDGHPIRGEFAFTVRANR